MHTTTVRAINDLVNYFSPKQRTLIANALIDKANGNREAVDKAEAEIAANPGTFSPFPATLANELRADADQCDELARIFEL